MRYITSVERIGIQKGMEKGMEKGLATGLQQGLESERRMLLRMVRRRFNEVIAEQSAPALEQIQQLLILEDLSEALFDCPDEQAWLARINAAAQRQVDKPPNSEMSL